MCGCSVSGQHRWMGTRVPRYLLATGDVWLVGWLTPRARKGRSEPGGAAQRCTPSEWEWDGRMRCTHIFQQLP